MLAVSARLSRDMGKGNGSKLHIRDPLSVAC